MCDINCGVDDVDCGLRRRTVTDDSTWLAPKSTFTCDVSLASARTLKTHSIVSNPAIITNQARSSEAPREYMSFPLFAFIGLQEIG